MIDPVALLAAVALAAAAGSGGHAADVVGRAAAYGAVAFAPTSITPALGEQRLRGWVARRAGLVPLPRGGNFNGVRWELAPEPFSLADADQVLQANAHCAWLRALRDGREPRAADVLAHADRWPAIAGRRAAAPVVRLGDDRSAQTDACVASHAGQVEYAVRRGLTPSS